ncbi:hypothetical protein BDL97_11G111000 [Sphagnum fallax]|nr:hypothetical protein BDL97_11G111000 [Sphagnum fallax]
MLQSVVGGSLEIADHWRSCAGSTSWNEVVVPGALKCVRDGMEAMVPPRHMCMISHGSTSTSTSTTAAAASLKISGMHQLPAAWSSNVVLQQASSRPEHVMEYEGPPMRVYMEEEEPVVDPFQQAKDWLDDAADDLADAVEWPNLPCEASPLNLILENSSCSNGGGGGGGEIQEEEENGRGLQQQNCCASQAQKEENVLSEPAEVCLLQPDSIPACTPCRFSSSSSSTGGPGVMATEEAAAAAAASSEDSNQQAAAAAPPPYLLDGNLRAVLKKVTVNEASLNKAIEGFGGGDKGMKVLLEYIMSWVCREQNHSNVSVVQHCLEQLNRQQQQQQQQKQLEGLGVEPPPAIVASQHLNPSFPMPTAAATPQPDDYMIGLSKSHGGSIVTSYALAAHEEDSEDHHLRSWQQLALLEQHWQQRLQQYADFCNTGRKPQQLPAMMTTSFASIVDVPAYDPQGAVENVSPVVGPYPSSSSSSSSSSAHGLQLPSVPSQLQQLGAAAAMSNNSLHSIIHSNFKSAWIPSSVSKQATAITMRAARKSRMAARQLRAHSTVPPRHYSRNAATNPGCNASISMALQPGDLKKLQMQQDLLTLGSEGQGRNMDSLLFLLHKELRPSDVSNLGRIVLPKKEAEHHLPFLAAREGQSIAMEDFDSGKIWTFRYRFWPNNKSRMYLLEITGGSR